jgi:hypothetical protein
MFPRDIIFGMILPLNLVEPSTLVVVDSVLLVENLGGVCLVCQIRFQWNGIFDSANSLGVILYGHLEIGAVSGYNSMVNSISRSGGMSGKSSGNTSRNSWPIGISSRF